MCTCPCVTYITDEIRVTPGTLYNKREENKTNIIMMVAAQVLLPYIGPPALRISGSASCGIVGRYARCVWVWRYIGNSLKNFLQKSKSCRDGG